MRAKLQKKLIAAFLFAAALPTMAFDYQENAVIELNTCDLEITADNAQETDNSVTYSGNVEVLLGFAKLRINKVTLNKVDEEHCELVANKDSQDASKNTATAE